MSKSYGLSGEFKLENLLGITSDPLYVIWPHRGSPCRRDISELLKLVEKSAPREEGKSDNLMERTMGAIHEAREVTVRTRKLIDGLSFYNLPGAQLIAPGLDEFHRNREIAMNGKTVYNFSRFIAKVAIPSDTLVFTYCSPRWNDRDGAPIEIPHLGQVISVDHARQLFSIRTSKGKRNFLFSRVMSYRQVTSLNEPLRKLKGFSYLKISTRGTHTVTWELTSDVPDSLRAYVCGVSFSSLSDKFKEAEQAREEEAERERREKEELEREELRAREQERRRALEEELSQRRAQRAERERLERKRAQKLKHLEDQRNYRKQIISTYLSKRVGQVIEFQEKGSPAVALLLKSFNFITDETDCVVFDGSQSHHKIPIDDLILNGKPIGEILKLKEFS